jgi:hypothetical protein
MSDDAIRSLLARSDDYPKSDGTSGFMMNRDGLIALLSECTPRLESISVIPEHHGEDLTSFTITTYVSFARSELEEGNDE